MRFQFPDGQIVMLDRPFVRDTVQYPAEWLRQMTVAERTQWGLVEIPEPAPPVVPTDPPVPHSITPRQARIALLAAGLLDQVETMVAASSREIQITWEFSLQIDRSSPLVDAMAASAGLTSAQVDDLFRSAAVL